MKNINFIIGLTIGALSVFVLMKRCHPKPVTTTTTTTTDTTDVWQPDTLHIPPIPEPEPVLMPPQAQIWRERYLHYKKEAIRFRSALDTVRFDLLDCKGRAEQYARQLKEYDAQLNEAGDLVEMLSQEIGEASSLKKYAGTDSTSAYIHTWEITTAGRLPAGGYKYRTDVLQRNVSNKVTVENWYLKRNSVGLLVGLQASGSDFQRFYAIQYARQGKTLGILLQPGYAPAHAGFGEKFQLLGGVKFNF